MNKGVKSPRVSAQPGYVTETIESRAVQAVTLLYVALAVWYL